MVAALSLAAAMWMLAPVFRDGPLSLFGGLPARILVGDPAVFNVRTVVRPAALDQGGSLKLVFMALCLVLCVGMAVFGLRVLLGRRFPRVTQIAGIVLASLLVSPFALTFLFFWCAARYAAQEGVDADHAFAFQWAFGVVVAAMAVAVHAVLPPHVADLRRRLKRFGWTLACCLFAATCFAALPFASGWRSMKASPCGARVVPEAYDEQGEWSRRKLARPDSAVSAFIRSLVGV